MNSFIYKMDIDIKLGDTMLRPAFTDDGGLRKFDKVFANPMWNQKFPQKTYEDDPYKRFSLGFLCRPDFFVMFFYNTRLFYEPTRLHRPRTTRRTAKT